VVCRSASSFVNLEVGCDPAIIELERNPVVGFLRGGGRPSAPMILCIAVGIEMALPLSASIQRNVRRSQRIGPMT
jgi:hypothetical protein